ncbi:MAG: hypothetical protein AAGF97_05800 [Planctomycetota bacterium]
MSRSSRASDSDPSYDSFLDIVANLVGILVILIMVIGVRTRNASREASHEPEPPPVVSSPMAASPAEPPRVDEIPTPPPAASPEADPPGQHLVTIPEPDPAIEAVAEKQRALEATLQTATSLEHSTLELRNQIQQIERASYVRARERDELQAVVVLAEQELAEKQQRLSAQLQAQLEEQKLVRELERELTDVETQLSATLAAKSEAQTLEHYPTPLAETVFGHEVHVRLQGGWLCRVPIDQIAETVDSDMQHNAWKLEHANEVTEVIGPFDGFRVRYSMRLRKLTIATPDGVARRGVLDTAFSLIPISPQLGEPLAQTLSAQTALRGWLESLDPQGTTITVWTYPDSYQEFRELKKFLEDRGFLTAARPMKPNALIRASSQGTRSVAQ